MVIEIAVKSLLFGGFRGADAHPHRFGGGGHPGTRGGADHPDWLCRRFDRLRGFGDGNGFGTRLGGHDGFGGRFGFGCMDFGPAQFLSGNNSRLTGGTHAALFLGHRDSRLNRQRGDSTAEYGRKFIVQAGNPFFEIGGLSELGGS